MTTATTIQASTRISNRLTFGHILAGEMRKSISTRANTALLIVIAGLTVLTAAGIHLLLPQFEGLAMNWAGLLPYVGLVSSLLLPVVVILLITSEWSTRCIMTTFTLAPRRGMVLAAKLIVALVMTVACIALCVALALGITALNATSSQVSLSWSAPTASIVTFVASTLASSLVAFALASALLNGPAAIVTFLGAPTVLVSVSAIGGKVANVTEWLNFIPALDKVLANTGSATAAQWGQLATSVTLWLILPAAIGIWRMLRQEAA